MSEPSPASDVKSDADGIDEKVADLSLSNEKRNKYKTAHQQDPISSRRRNTDANAENFQQDIPAPLTGLWRLYSDQIARESVESASQDQSDTGVSSLDAKLSVSSGIDDTTENPSPISQYGTPTKSPLIDEEDEFEQEPPKDKKGHRIPRTKTGNEGSVQFNMPQPLTGLWRRFSDMVAYENVQNDPPKQQSSTPVKGHGVVGNGDVGTPPPAALDATFDESDESQRSRRLATLYSESMMSSNTDDSSEKQSYESPALLFQGTFSNDEQGIDVVERDMSSSPYLDPTLVQQRAHHGRPHHSSIPKMVKIPSDSSLQDAPPVVSIHGDERKVSKGMVEVESGRFVRVHGERHAQSAIAKGQSIIVQCSKCQHKFQVDRKAGSLYCTHCKSVTKLHCRSAGPDSAGKSRTKVESTTTASI